MITFFLSVAITAIVFLLIEAIRKDRELTAKCAAVLVVWLFVYSVVQFVADNGLITKP